MNLSRISVFVCCLSLIGCKTSRFSGSGSVSENTNPNETTGGITPTPPTPPPGTTKPADPLPPVVTTPIGTTTTELQLNQTCEKPVQLLMAQSKLNFPLTKRCAFGTEPNLGRIRNHVQARNVQSMILKLPENSEICSMTLESPMASMRYDDLLILTIDDFVVFSSNKLLLPPLTQIGGLYKWDFLKVRGMKVDFKDPPYCIGAAERCQFPATDTVGAVVMKLNYSEIASIAKAIQGKAQVPIDLIATGDNDDGDTAFEGHADEVDCSHEALDLTISLNYIKKAK